MPMGACVAPAEQGRIEQRSVPAFDVSGAMPAPLAYNMAPLRFDLLPP